jgi:filamentous hemagglutinin family protein
MNQLSTSLTASILFSIVFYYNCGVRAQIIPDNTLQNNSNVIRDGNINRITGGMEAKNNLFHSFREFSVPTGGSAYFDNNLNIQNIFSRVTGNSISNIDGLIRANGTANLFLLNPNGIIFGPNARLNIGGSFLATTAESIVFSDKTSFSATNPQATPLLTINIPLGLQFNRNPAPIRVNGTGHNYRRPDPVFGLTTKGNEITGLATQPGRSIALIGGEISLTGGTLSALQGQIELGSAGGGFVGFSTTPSGWNFDYSGVTNFRDISLSQLAAADTAGNGGGQISLQARNIYVTGGSQILSQNIGLAPSGQLNINASEQVEISGTAFDLRIRTTIGGTTVGEGKGPDLNINSRRLVVRDGAAVSVNTFGSGMAGQLTLNAAEYTEISGTSPINPAFFTFVGTPTFISGKGGDVVISTEKLRILGGGAVTSLTLGSGKAGDVTVNARDVEISGSEPIFSQQSALTSSTFGSGNAGDLIVNTSKLTLANGGAVAANTLNSGSAGSVTINALDSVEISGFLAGPDRALGSTISSSAEILSLPAQQRFGLPPFPSGNGSDVTVNTRTLIAKNNAVLNVRNIGSGNAGTLRVNAEKIVAATNGGLVATTLSGEGGNIVVKADSLQLRNGGVISATAGGTGNGGNLEIDAGSIALLGNSSITANAVRGRGGNIQINTQGLFQSPQSRITASSEFGVSGAVQFNTPDRNPSADIVKLPENPIDPSALIAQDPCAGSSQNSFAVVGRGGLPPSPDDPLSSTATAIEWAAPETAETRSTAVSEPTPNREAQIPEPIIQATGWKIGADGKVVLTGDRINSAYNRENVNQNCRLRQNN